MNLQTDTQTDTKLTGCREILQSPGSVVAACSAGVESTLLLALAVQTLRPSAVPAAMGVSPSLAEREPSAERAPAEKLGATLVEVPTGEMEDLHYVANCRQRFFDRKKDLFKPLTDLARQRGRAVVVSGANAADRADFRPGLRWAACVCVVLAMGLEIAVAAPSAAPALQKPTTVTQQCATETCHASIVGQGRKGAQSCENVGRYDPAAVAEGLGRGQYRGLSRRVFAGGAGSLSSGSDSGN
jgi:PP-loop superfamily ATP-utilizing enzyme